MSGANWQRRLDPLRELQREMGRLFESLEPLSTMRLPRPFPAINLYDAGDRYILTAEIPGVSPDDIELALTGETLTLRGERKRPEGIDDESYRRQERPFGRWSRSVTLPERVQGDQVGADYAHGILSVTLPKSEDSRPRHIAVRSSGG